MYQRPRTQTLLVIATSLVVSWLASVAEAQRHRSSVAGSPRTGSGHQASAVSTRPAPRRQQPPNHLRRPGILSPGGLGSAANVRPGFYRQLDAPRHHVGRGGHHGQVVPIYVYPTYYPEPFYAPAPVYSEPEPRQAPAAAQPQIYIVTPPVIAAPAPVVAPAPTLPPPVPRSTAPGEIKFSVQPADARVYLDDDYLGTGAELAALEAASLFPPGVHVLEVTHPHHRPQRLVFGVSDTDPAHVLIDLSIDRISRRTRVK